MNVPRALHVGPPRQDDLPAIAALVRACEIAEHGRSDSDEADLRSEWAWPRFDHERDAWLARDAEARVVGYARLWRRSATGTEFDGGLFVAPAHLSAAGAALLDPLERRAHESSPGAAAVAILCASVNASKRDLLARRGYAPVRYSFRMEIGLEADPPRPPWPAGFEPAVFRRGVDESAIHATLEESFADHFRFQPWPLDEWTRLAIDHEYFAPQISFLVRQGSEPVAAVTNYMTPELGWVGMLGVRPAWRGRGLGSALLLESFRAFAAAGRREVALGVDAQNAHGAVRLYERLGMRVAQRHELFEKRLQEP